eukprot:TRINITY_DN8179_c0_g1_i3.p1 TRINITY_DN8179_c0_g1~~TRINITY_DN8179_c0_g1_i3.p1  ORF type:complete len:297 (+),score=18.12 TRINITY_DN8179_c0_g1_i3:64-954(+)
MCIRDRFLIEKKEAASRFSHLLHVNRECNRAHCEALEHLSSKLNHIIHDKRMPMELSQIEMRPVLQLLRVMELYSRQSLLHTKTIVEKLNASRKEFDLRALLHDLSQIFTFYHAQRTNIFELEIGELVPDVIISDPDILGTVLFLLGCQSLRERKRDRIELRVQFANSKIYFTHSEYIRDKTKLRMTSGMRSLTQKIDLSDISLSSVDDRESREVVLCRALLNALDPLTNLTFLPVSRTEKDEKVYSSQFFVRYLPFTKQSMSSELPIRRGPHVSDLKTGNVTPTPELSFSPKTEV